ncbi:putative methyltransferase NSUN7 [Babylonia areolata]|uniref:putative methyltransferase NSUN7 n=1 Tax=Babylonia areolata TaxID=304850 RepID=UPI003FD5C55B
MPPVAGEMAGGTGLQPSQATKKKGKRTPSISKEGQRQNKQERTFQGHEDADTPGPSENSGNTDNGDDEAPITMMQLHSASASHSKAPSSTMDKYSSDPNLAEEFFKKEPCIYSHRMFVRAAKIFDGLRKARDARLEERKKNRRAIPGTGEKAGAAAKRGGGAADELDFEPVDFKNVKEQKLTFELAFLSLKFEKVFEEMLDDCAFSATYPDFKDDECLVMVVLWDYQSRKFQPRIQFDADELDPFVSRIERAILEQKVKLAASLARRRIKESAPTIDYLLPDNLRSKATSQKPLPVYCWVNTGKISPSDLLQKLKMERFVQLWSPPQKVSEFQERSFYFDPQCSDVLVFSTDCNAILQEHPLLEEGYIVRQDRSSCLAAHSVMHLLGDEQEVAVVNPGAGITAAHLAVLLRERKGGVVAICEDSDDVFNKLMRTIELIGVTQYVKVIRESFVDMNPDDPRLKGVRAAIVTANCSKSAVANIVNYIVTEGENLTVLKDMSDNSEDQSEKLDALQSDHSASLRHALKLSRINGVTYLTRSIHDEENNIVVQKATEFINMVQMAKHLRPWRLIPPVLPFNGDQIDDQVGIVGKTVFFHPTEFMNGCYIVCIAREPEDPTDTARLKAKSSKTKVKGSSSDSSTGSAKGRKTKGPKGKGKVSGGGRGVGGGGTGNSSSSSGSASGSASGSPATASAPTARSRFSARQATMNGKVPEHVRVVKHPAPFR